GRRRRRAAIAAIGGGPGPDRRARRLWRRPHRVSRGAGARLPVEDCRALAAARRGEVRRRSGVIPSMDITPANRASAEAGTRIAATAVRWTGYALFFRMLVVPTTYQSIKGVLLA